MFRRTGLAARMAECRLAYALRRGAPGPEDAHVRLGDLAAYSGIASGYVTAWGNALGTAPHLCCIAWTTRDLPEVRAALRNRIDEQP